MSSDVGAGDTVVRDLEIVNQRGLHARASARFVQVATRCARSASEAMSASVTRTSRSISRRSGFLDFHANGS